MPRGPWVYFSDIKCEKDTKLAILAIFPMQEGMNLTPSDRRSEIGIHKSQTEIWIPKSQIHDDSEVFEANTEGRLVLSEWICNQKDLQPFRPKEYPDER